MPIELSIPTNSRPFRTAWRHMRRTRFYLALLCYIACGLLSLPSQANAQMTALCSGCSTPIDAHGYCYRVYNGTGATIMIPWRSAAEWISFINGRPGGVSLSSCVVPLSLVGYGASTSCYGEGCVFYINFTASGGSGSYRVYTENYGGAYISTHYVGSGPIDTWMYGYNSISMSGNTISTSHYAHVTGGVIQAWVYDNNTGQVATASFSY